MTRVYVDFDDVISQTARAFVQVLEELFAKRVPFEEITSFDLRRSFDLTTEELDRFMVEAHRPERLMAVEPMDGAIEVLASWSASGHRIDVMTGRPPSSGDASRAWLERHTVPHSDLCFVDKYSRYDDAAWVGHGRVVRLEELHGDRYDFIVEDNLDTAAYLADATSARVLLLDRPWNRDLSELSAATAARVERCRDWSEIASAV